MTKAGRTYLPVLLLLSVAASAPAAGLRAGTPVTAADPAQAAQWGAWIDGQVTGGAWRLVVEQRDADFPGRYHRRYEQVVGGAAVFGSGLARQMSPSGTTQTVFGYRYDNLTLDTTPSLTVEEAKSAVVEALGAGSQAVGDVRLTILPLETGTYLTYMLWGKRMDPPSLMRYFIDARTGAAVFAYQDLKSEAAVAGVGSGVWGDRKKLGANRSGSTYLLEDLLRPARATTYDMRFDIMAFYFQSLVGFESADSDADWTDGAAVDAHAYAGATYDYYYARHGRHGIDDHDMPIRSFVHVAYFVNAYWDDDIAAMLYGDGGSEGGASYKPLSCAVDIVAHEMTHGVTSRTWNGYYYGESGALNEAFSDIMGTAVEFYIQPVGDGRGKADYWCAEDISETFDPARYAFRSMSNPSLFCHSFGPCDPDHYSKRYLGSVDGGGVHINSGIANHAFYLLIEGGTNRTSGLTVTGLGSASRDRAEKIFYRGFTKYLTTRATFHDARVATIQAAVELYGAGSTEATRMAEAWTAVGVQ